MSFRRLHLQHVRPHDRQAPPVPAAQEARDEGHQGPAHHVHLQACKWGASYLNQPNLT